MSQVSPRLHCLHLYCIIHFRSLSASDLVSWIQTGFLLMAEPQKRLLLGIMRLEETKTRCCNEEGKWATSLMCYVMVVCCNYCAAVLT